MSERITKSGNNPKPVVFHSVRVAKYIWDLGCDVKCIVAAVLHDIIEDSDTTMEEIKKKFGKKVAELVEVTTFNSTILDKTEKYLDSFNRANRYGKDALLIRAADILDNSEYYVLAPTKETFLKLLTKMKDFIDISEEKIRDIKPWKELKNKYRNLLNSEFV